MLGMLRAIWAYRFFILSSIRTDLRSRFVRSKLGGLWMIIHPLAQVLIFALILSEVLSAKLPGVDNKYAYSLYLMAGTLAWSLFSETINKCCNLFVENGNLLKKMAFPRICLPLIAGGTMLVNNVLLLLAIFGVFAMLGHMPGMEVVWLPVLILITLAFALSLGMILGILNTFMRDIAQVVPVVLQALFWMTPVVYMLTILPESYRRLFAYNPLYPLVTSYQNVLVFNRPPLFHELAYLVIASLLMLAVGLIMFRRASPEMVDVL
ncbi:ABC transporter permease [Pseudoxanthomonas winnipegensis]|uniref:Transport permease protein n=1 Tax=Pseudoxanthomonas winnipegensis TaxID=2480810 RepID=A0A4Q8LPG4_9GAMM|nr:ABC transporter permease [Pseudoxanthomonas winnipegensis]RZZ89471.1 ABC transporter permease [Pseudoxanthomonas winnipegensis]TAA33087.1 ABC transporter permease [Pseudoxanthomonas winnipegensis]TBV78429.1 ABC transporter permease [Pseudoxanthomonas winnipegensis]